MAGGLAPAPGWLLPSARMQDWVAGVRRDSARLNYTFANNRIAGPYAQRSGTLNLKRMGGCAP